MKNNCLTDYSRPTALKQSFAQIRHSLCLTEKDNPRRMKNESHLVGKELGIVLISGILITNWGKGDGAVMLNVWYNFANNVRVLK